MEKEVRITKGIGQSFMRTQEKKIKADCCNQVQPANSTGEIYLINIFKSNPELLLDSFAGSHKQGEGDKIGATLWFLHVLILLTG